jgi:hypothetical protein
MRVYTLTIAPSEEEVTGLKPGTYVAHVSDEAVSIAFKPKGKHVFRVARAMDEEK